MQVAAIGRTQAVAETQAVQHLRIQHLAGTPISAATGTGVTTAPNTLAGMIYSRLILQHVKTQPILMGWTANGIRGRTPALRDGAANIHPAVHAQALATASGTTIAAIVMTNPAGASPITTLV